MKIYFAGSIRGGREDVLLYEEIITLLGNHGEVLTEHIGDKTLSVLGEDGPTDDYIYRRDISWLQSADVMVAEVTQPSLGVGYEIGKAEEWRKPILCIYRSQPNKRLSAMITGNPHLSLSAYQDIPEVKAIVHDFFAGLP